MTPRGPAGPLPRLLTSLSFAALQLALLAGVWAAKGLPGRGWILGAQLGLLCACTLTVAWNRRPYDKARLGFLLVHAAPLLLVLGLVGQRWAAVLGVGCLALGLPWMFYLKPLLKGKKGGAEPPAWQVLTLQGTRVLFMVAGALLIRPLLTWTLPPPWLPICWLCLAVALHVHHIKAWKGRKAQFAGLAAWGLSLAAYLRLR